MTSGDVVVLDFPFSDLSGSKLRPAVLLSAVGSNDFIACQITSNREADPDSIELAAVAFASGSLRVTSYARPGKLFTANRRIVSKRVARLTGPLQEQIKEAVIRVIRHG